MKVVNAGDVKSFWDYMTKRYKTVMVNKANANEMKIIASMLSMFGIMDYKKFMSQFCTTIGNRIYLSTNYNKLKEVDKIALCVHEHVHVRQFREDPALSMIKYATNRAERTLYECEAYRSNMEILFYLTGSFPSPADYANLLVHYNVDKKDIKFANEYLTKSADVIKKGGIITPESKVAITWMKKNLVDAIPNLRVVKRRR